MEKIMAYANRILEGGEITLEEAEDILNTPDEDTFILLAMADKIRQKFCGDEVDLCAIVNGRSGRCPENCNFCAQSAHYNTGVAEYPLMDADALVNAAKKAKEAGAIRFSIVTSGRNTSNPNEFEQILTALTRIKEEVGVEICCSLGLLSLEQGKKLREIGVTRYHSNIETAPSHFPNICTTHNYDDKMSTIANAKAAGMRVCSGGILNLGETKRQRAEMAFELKRLEVDSIPLNILNPIKNTPQEGREPLHPLEILRTFAMFRFVHPRAQIRTAGGRELNLRSLQPYILSGGLNGIMVGNYLTTEGRDPQEDIHMIDDLALKRTQPNLES